MIAHALLEAFRVETNAPDDMIAALATIADVPAPTPRPKRKKR